MHRWCVFTATLIVGVAACDRRVVPTTPDDAPVVEQTPARPNGPPKIRVRLHAVEAHGHTQIEAPEATIQIRAGDVSCDSESSLRVERRGGKWVFRGNDFPSALHTVDSFDITTSNPMTIAHEKGRTYQGIIRCVTRGSDAFDVINVIPMNEYIPGVLAGELYEGWHDAAFEAQAIAARSFAKSECEQRRNRVWDVTDTPASQVFVGIAPYPQAHRCADATIGQVLTWNGALVPGYFSSCCGGRAATAIDAVGPNPINNVPPLNGHEDPPRCTEAPRYRWELSWPCDKVSRAVRSWGRRNKHDDAAHMGTIESITPTTPNQHGRPTKVVIRDDGGRTIDVRCVDLPWILGSAGLETPSSGWLGAERHGAELVAHGRGFGHGVGLCQYGAESMASTGSAPDHILRFYYPGAEITKEW